MDLALQRGHRMKHGKTALVALPSFQRFSGDILERNGIETEYQDVAFLAPLMQPLFTAPVPKLGSESHPYFVGLAHLRSLLMHEEIVHDEVKSDAVLDVIGLLLRQAPAGHVIKAFCRMRLVCGQACYLALYRLRRWMEGEVRVRVGQGAWQALELKFADFRKVQQDYARAEWETNVGAASLASVPVIFCWRGVGALEAECARLPDFLTA